MKFINPFLAAAGILAAFSACNPTEPVDQTEDEIIGGFPLRSERFDAVGALAFADTLQDGSRQYFCSGTLISPTMVLTAKHCIPTSTATQYGFAIGYDSTAPKAFVPAIGAALEDTIVTNDEWGADVAVVHLATPVDNIKPFAYGVISPQRVGEKFVAIGYGAQDIYHTDGTREAGRLTLRGLSGRALEAVFGSLDAFLARVHEVLPSFDPKDPEQVEELTDFYNGFLLTPEYEAAFGKRGRRCPIVLWRLWRSGHGSKRRWGAHGLRRRQLGDAKRHQRALHLDLYLRHVGPPQSST